MIIMIIIMTNDCIGLQTNKQKKTEEEKENKIFNDLTISLSLKI